MYPSVEAALTEISLLLTERERELGGLKTSVVYGHFQDPALDHMAKTLSSAGLDTRAKKSSELSDAAAWFPEVKPKTLLVAYAEDDRFTGEVYDVAAFRDLLFSDGVRIPVLSVCFGATEWRETLPRPFEVRMYDVRVIDNEFVTILIAGERLRLEPRMAPLSLSESRLKRIERALVGGELRARPDTLKDRLDIETFEAGLPEPFQPKWSKGASRLLDRAIVSTEAHDGSWILEKLKLKLQAQRVDLELIEAGLFSLSGCTMNDERRQEWLRSRGQDPWLTRGTIHISLDLLRSVSTEAWLTAFNEIHSLK